MLTVIAFTSIWCTCNCTLYNYRVGFNVETVEYNGINFTTWDVSGRDGIVGQFCEVLTSINIGVHIAAIVETLH